VKLAQESADTLRCNWDARRLCRPSSQPAGKIYCYVTCIFCPVITTEAVRILLYFAEEFAVNVSAFVFFVMVFGFLIGSILLYVVSPLCPSTHLASVFCL